MSKDIHKKVFSNYTIYRPGYGGITKPKIDPKILKLKKRLREFLKKYQACKNLKIPREFEKYMRKAHKGGYLLKRDNIENIIKCMFDYK